MFKYSYDALVYFGEDIEKSAFRVASCGYDAIEIIGEPDIYEISRVIKSCKDNGIVVSSICPIFNEKRDLVSPELKERKKAIEYVKKVADLAAAVGAPVMIMVPTACMKIARLASSEQELEWTIQGIYEGGEYANSINVKLALGAWNRYETYFLNRIEQCLDLMKKIKLPNLGIMGDTFHMNIEEKSIAKSIYEAGSDLIHMRIADSNRAAPGEGHIDFLPILKALRNINYKGYLTFELLPAAADPFQALRKGGHQEFFDKYTKQSIDYIKALVKEIK